MIEMPPMLGWDAAWEAARAAADPTAAWQPVRVAAEHRGAYQARGPDRVAWIEVAGIDFHRAQDKRALPTVGDWVLVEGWADAVDGAGSAIVRAILPRRSLLVRRTAGNATLPQPLAANVDVGLIMTSANSDLSPARLDRYILLLRDGGIEPVLLLSKIDLIEDPAPVLARLAEIAPVRVLAVSSAKDVGLEAVRAIGGVGRTCVLLGSSGVGKSTLLNVLLGLDQATEEIRDDDRGRHTTTHRELFVGDDGMWIDTPGMRELAQWVDDPEEEPTFDDIAALAAGCRFRDCHHGTEPGCAVRDAVPADRLASFHKLADERSVATRRQDEAARQAVNRRGAKAKTGKPTAD